jgi:hypothetical protein
MQPKAKVLEKVKMGMARSAPAAFGEVFFHYSCIKLETKLPYTPACACPWVSGSIKNIFRSLWTNTLQVLDKFHASDARFLARPIAIKTLDLRPVDKS